VFEDAAGGLRVPSSEALAELLSRRQVRTAILNACFSLSVGRFAGIGLDFTVASTGPVADPAAIEFTRGFYDAVGAGEDIPEAYEEGLSCARLKGYVPDVVLLRRGESYIAEQREHDVANVTRDTSPNQDLLLGIALDTSGSMRDSIRNESGGALSRLESARQAIEKFGRSVQANLQSSVAGSKSFHLFAYAFGLRIGEFGDLISLIRASKRIDLQSEIQNRRRKYEAEARNQATGFESSFGGLAAAASEFGFGDIVRSVADATRSQVEDSIRERIISEIAGLLQRNAMEIGDSTLTVGELAEFWGTDGPATLEDIEPLIYGATPMSAAASAIKARFERTKAKLGGDPNSILLVISDGEPTDGNPQSSFEAMRGAGVVVVSCFVTNDNILDSRKLVAAPELSWSNGARLMFEIASPVDEKGPLARYLLGEGWVIEPSARLFVQVNHSAVLEEFVRSIESQVSRTGADLLPAGR